MGDRLKWTKVPQLPRAHYEVDVTWDYVEWHLEKWDRAYGLVLDPDYQRNYDDWLAEFRRDEVDYLPDAPVAARLDDLDIARLLGWVSRRMAESGQRTESALVAEVFEAVRWTADGHEAAAWGDYERGKAMVRALCEAAGWPS